MLSIFSALPCRLDDTLLTVTWMSWPLFSIWVVECDAHARRSSSARSCARVSVVGGLELGLVCWSTSAGSDVGKEIAPTPVLDVCIFFILWLLYCWQGAYPARLKKVLVVTAPLWFKAPFKILRLFVREKLRDRVYTVSLPQVRMEWRRWEIERELLLRGCPCATFWIRSLCLDDERKWLRKGPAGYAFPDVPLSRIYVLVFLLLYWFLFLSLFLLVDAAFASGRATEWAGWQLEGGSRRLAPQLLQVDDEPRRWLVRHLDRI